MMVLIIVVGPWSSDLNYNFTTNATDNTDEGVDKLKHMTLMFNTFVFLQIFNEFNCRKIGVADFNILEGVTRNIYFLTVVFGTFAAQIILTRWFPALTRTTAISRTEWGSCVMIGATPLIIAPLLKLTPESWLKKMKLDKVVDENKSMEGNKLLAAYDKAANIKVGEDEKKEEESDNYKKV